MKPVQVSWPKSLSWEVITALSVYSPTGPLLYALVLKTTFSSVLLSHFTDEETEADKLERDMCEAKLSGNARIRALVSVVQHYVSCHGHGAVCSDLDQS